MYIWLAASPQTPLPSVPRAISARQKLKCERCDFSFRFQDFFSNFAWQFLARKMILIFTTVFWYIFWFCVGIPYCCREQAKKAWQILARKIVLIFATGF